MPAPVFDVDEWMAHAPSTWDDLAAIATLLADFPHPWFFCGGWAIDLYWGHQMREHKDVDIGIFRSNQLAIQAHLMARGWQLAIADSGVLTEWQQDVWLELPLHTIWCRNLDHEPVHLEVLLNEGDASRFRFRRNLALTQGGTDAIHRSVDGLPFLAPEIALLYKSAHVELVENQRDFDHSLPHLRDEQRLWLREGLRVQYEHHPWLEQLND